MRYRETPAVVFAGGGHAHLYSLLRTGCLVKRGCKVVLVNPTPYLYYSGMATGVVSYTYSPEEDRLDVRRLVERGGGRFVEGRVERVIREEQTLLLEDGRRVSYSVASFCMGSDVSDGGLSKDGERIIPVKPVENMVEIRDRLLQMSPNSGRRVLVVGGGAAGCEVAANAANLMRERGIGDGVSVAEAGPSLLPDAPEKARREIQGYLESRGVEVLLNSTVAAYEADVAMLEDGREIEADLLVRATGLAARPVFLRSRGSLATGDDGGLWVDRYLRSISDRRLFGGGDSISFRGESLPRLGVFAIRQGPVLFHNLQATLLGGSLKPFEPQRRYLCVLNLGDGTGLAIYGPLVWRGRSAMALKHAIDRRFMNEYRAGPELSEDSA